MSAPDLCDGCLAERAWCVCGVGAAMTAGQRAILPLLTGRLDPEEAADLQPLTRANVERPGRAWSWSSWECDACGELLACRADKWGALYDGDPLVCLTCGAVARVSADAESPAYPSDAWGHLTEGAHADLYAEMYRDDADVIAALRGGVDAGHDQGGEHRDPP